MIDLDRARGTSSRGNSLILASRTTQITHGAESCTPHNSATSSAKRALPHLCPNFSQLLCPIIPIIVVVVVIIVQGPGGHDPLPHRHTAGLGQPRLMVFQLLLMLLQLLVMMLLLAQLGLLVLLPVLLLLEPGRRHREIQGLVRLQLGRFGGRGRSGPGLETVPPLMSGGRSTRRLNRPPDVQLGLGAVVVVVVDCGWTAGLLLLVLLGQVLAMLGHHGLDQVIVLQQVHTGGLGHQGSLGTAGGSRLVLFGHGTGGLGDPPAHRLAVQARQPWALEDLLLLLLGARGYLGLEGLQQRMVLVVLEAPVRARGAGGQRQQPGARHREPTRIQF